MKDFFVWRGARRPHSGLYATTSNKARRKKTHFYVSLFTRHDTSHLALDLNRLKEIDLKMHSVLLAALLGTALAAAAQDSANVANQCIVGAVKLAWKPVPRCIVFDSEAKFKATLETWGWDPKQMPKVNWAKDIAVVDSANTPYGNAAAACEGLFTDAQKKTGTLRWAWQQNNPQSSAAAREKAKADAPKPDPAKDDKKITEKMKDSVTQVGSDAKQGFKDVVEDFKKFPSPIPKRAAIVATIPKDLLGSKPKIDCVMTK
jgi:hypothetical protein